MLFISPIFKNMEGILLYGLSTKSAKHTLSYSGISGKREKFKKMNHVTPPSLQTFFQPQVRDYYNINDLKPRQKL
jgi:hypothetical protein